MDGTTDSYVEVCYHGSCYHDITTDSYVEVGCHGYCCFHGQQY